MTKFNRTILFTFVVCASVFYRLINAQTQTTALSSSFEMTVDLDETTGTISSTTTSTATRSTVTSTTASVSNNSTKLTNTSVSSSSTSTTSTTTDQSTITDIDDLPPPSDNRSGPGWWLLVGLLVTIVIVIIAGIILYYRQHSPYRRFLRNWQSRDDDADNIILQLEQPETTNGQWPPRISFT